MRLFFCIYLSGLFALHKSHAQPAWVPSTDQISFTYKGEILVIGPDRDLINLTNSQSTEIHKSFSPDGQKVAFDSDRSGAMEIYTMNLDGSDLRQLTFDSSRNLVPVWSKDGKKIAFNSTRDGNWEIYTMDLDGTNQVNVSNNSASDLVRSWSWDGEKILFDSDRAGSRDIYVMDKDGTDVKVLVDWPSNERIAMAAPDDRIAFSSDKNGNEDIFIMDENGGNVNVLVQTEGNEFYPFFSVENRNIITLISDASGEREVYTLNINKGKMTQITKRGKFSGN